MTPLTSEALAPEVARQTLQVLQAVELRLLMESWTTILLDVVLLLTLLFQVSMLVRWEKTAAVFPILIGLSLFYLPCEIAPLFAWLITSAGCMLLFKGLLFPDHIHSWRHQRQGDIP